MEATAVRTPARTTLALAAVTIASVVLAHADPWEESGEGPTFVSSKSAARRVLPDLPDALPEAVAHDAMRGHGRGPPSVDST